MTSKKTRSELANASQDDLIRMLLEAEKRSSSVSEKISKKVEQAEAVNNSANDDTTDDAAVDTKAEESTGKETKKRAKAPRGRKKNTDETVEGNESKPETENKPADDKSEKQSEDVKEAVDNLANSQEAPFPDFPGMNAPTESEPQVAEDSSKESEPIQENNNLEDEESVNAQEPFQMFDENEEPF